MFDFAGGFVDDDELRGIAVLDEPHAIRADGLRGVDFRSRRSVEIPNHFLVRRDFGDAKLVSEKNVPIRLQHRVADLATAGMRVGPDDLAAANNRHPLLFRLTRVEEIMLRKSVAGQNGRSL